MKHLPVVTAAAFALALGATSSFAMVSTTDLRATVQSAISSGNVNVQVQGDTAYLSGWVNGSLERQAATQAALGADGIERVVSTVQF